MKPIDPVDVAESVVYILSTPPHVQVIKSIPNKHFNILYIIGTLNLGSRYYDATNRAKDISVTKKIFLKLKLQLLRNYIVESLNIDVFLRVSRII